MSQTISSTLADPSSAPLTIGSMRKWASGWLRVRLANEHHRTQDYIWCRGGAPTTTTTTLAIRVVPLRRFTTDYATSTTAWVSMATCCEVAFTAGAESFANAYDTYESPFGDGGIIPMPAGAATHGGDSPSFSQIMKLNHGRTPCPRRSKCYGRRVPSRATSSAMTRSHHETAGARPRSLTACG